VDSCATGSKLKGRRCPACALYWSHGCGVKPVAVEVLKQYFGG
jgi:hypothetical protein